METKQNIRNISIISHVDAGKCLGYGTKIRTMNGTTKLVENLTVNDFVLGLDGEPKKILEIHHGHGQLYKISQKLGEDYVVNGNHILVLKFTNVEGIFWEPCRCYYRARYIQNMRIHDKCFQHDNFKELTQEIMNDLYKQAESFLLTKSQELGYNRKGDVIEISVSDYLKLPSNMKRILYGFKQGVEFDEQEIELDPYLLGAWLGDGTSCCADITNIDVPIIDYLYSYADENNLVIKCINDITYCLRSKNNIRGENSFLNSLKHYNLINNKHIPKEYLYNSRDIRLKVLAGLIDTDGYSYNNNNMYEIAQKSDHIARDIVELCRSLGLRISRTKRQKACYKPDGSKVFGWYNIMQISGKGLEEVPVLLKRKKVTPVKDIDYLITQITVEPTYIGKYAGFQIEGDGKFFGTDFTVLHNSTLTDSLVCKAGLISEKDAGEKRWTDGRPDEQERGITIKSTGVSMEYNIDGENYKVNLVDSPGHIDFSHEVSAALRITDGAIVVLDAVEGVCVQTETVLRQAMAEQVKPIMYINKLDRYIFELKLSAEEMYQRMVKIIESVNNIISIYKTENSNLMLDLLPELGNVYFGSAYHGWGFGIKQFAKKMASKFGSDENKLMKQLWGEVYFDPETKKITTCSIGSNGKPLERTFCKFILQPILDLIKEIYDKNTTKYTKMLEPFGIKLTNNELALSEREIYKLIMKKFLPLADALLEGIIYHLPSPQQAQSYRYTTLYDGPLDDECATAIKNCDENGPLMVYVSKMIPMIDGSRFYAFGRVFSGRISAGQKVRILGSNYKPESNSDCYENKSIQRVAKMIGGKAETCEYVSCGNTVAIIGVDQYLLKSGTITTSVNGYPIKTMKFSVSPIVQVAVSPKNASDLPKLVEGLKKLSKSDPSVQCFISESGDHIVAGVGELHVEICLNDLRDFMKTDIKVSQPIVPLRETVIGKSSQDCLSKSPNKHNRLYMTAEALDSKLIDDLIDGVVTSRDDINKRSKHLVDKYGWDVNESKKIWAFGPEGDEETNTIVDCTKGVQYMNEIRDHVRDAFKVAMTRGVLCDEPVRGVKFNINDVTLHADAIHRGGGQITPAARRCMIASMLTATPAIMEPMYLVEIQVPQTYIGTIYSCLQNKRGEVFTQEQSIGELSVVKGYLPVYNSFGFCSYLREQTSGQATAQLSFDHWRIVPGDPLDKSTLAGQMVSETRKRKGLSEEIPPLTDFLDKL
jgi:elongation factor 2